MKRQSCSWTVKAQKRGNGKKAKKNSENESGFSLFTFEAIKTNHNILMKGE